MKNLQDLMVGIETLQIKGSIDVSVSSVALNSNDIKSGSLFIALAGNKTDGHLYIDHAIGGGASVVVYENNITSYKDTVTYIQVLNTHEAAGIIASNFYDNPSQKLQLIGITGTNGKTTTTTLLHQLFRNLGHKAGMIGTVVNKVNDMSYEAERTTPNPIDLNKLLYSMVDRGCKYCFMEVSSHSISENRISGLVFAGGVFTNLTHDHLDYHKTIDNYRDAKKLFFDGLPDVAFALSNKDDPSGEYMLRDTHAKKYFYALKCDADFTDRLETKLIGEFNAYNALAVYATATLLNQDKKNVKELIKGLKPVEGRFNYIKSENGVTGIVDYAHTPDALQNVIKAIIEMRGAAKNRRIISVFGCGGDRDRSKRPLMARIGYDMSDILILTSDNPRTEKPENILQDMKSDLPAKDTVHIIVDRKEAIETACQIAQKGDYILLAGKGHEKYQEVDGVKTHFDDMEELKKGFNM